MEENSFTIPEHNRDFKPPKLPLGWLASTFVAPILIVVVPNVFASNEVSLTTRIIAALALLSCLLFTSCIVLTLKLYNSAYTSQVLNLEFANIKEQYKRDMDIQNKFIENERNEANKLKHDAYETISKVNDLFEETKLALTEKIRAVDK